MPAKLPSDTIDGVEWIEVNDFTPGIRQIISPNHPDGSATEANTYACIAQAGGALVPLPAVSLELTLPSAAPYTGETPSTPFYIVGAFCNDPVFSLDGGNQTLGGPDQNNSELYIAGYYWVEGDTSQVNSLTVENATGGTLTITVDTMTNGIPDNLAETTSTIAYNATAGAVETALEALTNVTSGDVACAGGPLNTSAVSITWANALAAQSILVYANGDALTGSGTQYAAISVTTGADLKCREVWRLMLNRESPVEEEILSSTDDTQWFASVRPRVCEFGTGRSNSADNTTLGPTVLAFTFDGLARIFPDDTEPQSLSTAQMAGEAVALVLPAHQCLHQGRAVIFPLTLASMGPLQIYTTTEGFYWTDVNDFTSLSNNLTGYFNVVVLPEFPTGYGVMESLTADELLLIKARGGGLILRGSLDDYSAKSLPNIKSTGQSLNRGSRSPIGFLYPTDAGGVWLWSGGDTSTHVSKDMDDEFWRPDYSDADLYPFGPGYTSCAQWGEWVMFPNNWLFDTDFGGWWRIREIDTLTEENHTDLPDVIHHWTVDWKGRHAYGFMDRSFGDDSIIGYDFDKLTPASSFSWQSQPLAATLDREVQCRRLVVVASGAGTIVAKVRSNQTGSEQTLSTITVASESGVAADYPTAYAVDCAVQGSHVQVQFTSAHASTGAAPTIHGFRLAVDARARLKTIA